MHSANFARLRGHYYSASALSQVSENRDSIISVVIGRLTRCVVGYSAKGLNLFFLVRGTRAIRERSTTVSIVQINSSAMKEMPTIDRTETNEGP